MIGHAVRLNPLSFWLWRRLARAQENVTDALKVYNDAAHAVKTAAKKSSEKRANAPQMAGESSVGSTSVMQSDDIDKNNSSAQQLSGAKNAPETSLGTANVDTISFAAAAKLPPRAHEFSREVGKKLLAEYVLCEATLLCESGNATQAEERLRSVLSDWCSDGIVDGTKYEDITDPSGGSNSMLTSESSPPKGLWSALLHVAAFGCLPAHMVRGLGYGACEKLALVDCDSCRILGEDVGLAFEEAFLG
jgi:hypothetical protein